jgi:hypothetical protein
MSKRVKFEPHREGNSWRLNIPAHLSETGKRQRLYFQTKEKALAERERLKTRKDNFGITLAALSPAKISEAAEAYALLADHPGVSLLSVVKGHIKTTKARTQSVTFHYDEGDFSAHFPEDVAASVNRLCVTGITESLAIFKKTIERNDMSLCGYATFQHGQLKAKTAEYVEQNKPLKKQGFRVQIEIAPVYNVPGRVDNPGHAEIMPKVTRGLVQLPL